MKEDKFEHLMEKAIELMAREEFDEAEQVLQKIINETAEDQNIVALNNLTSITLQRGKVDQAFKILQPYIEADPPIGNPYTFGLAAQITARLGHSREAKKYLDYAIQLFEKGIPHLKAMGYSLQAWYEYTIQFIRAAGDLDDHRLVIDLYRRHEKYHVNWENRYKVGIAYFNLKRYKQAASAWEPLNQVGNFSIPMQRVAFLMERNVIPHFALGYSTPEWDDVIERYRAASDSKELREEALCDGYIRIILLDTLFGEHTNEKEKKNALSLLISYGGKWGLEFGKRLLETSVVSTEIKMSTLFNLVEQGVYREDEEVPVIIDGRETMVRVEKKEVSFEPNQELDIICEEAISLRNAGEIDEAIALLEPHYLTGGVYPRLMITLGNLYRNKKNWEPAQHIFEMLAEAFDDEPVVMINLAGLYVETDAFDQAFDCIAKIEKIELDETMRERLSNIRELAENRLAAKDYSEDLKNQYIYRVAEEMRGDIEVKKIAPESMLSRGLKNMPNEWLLNICDLYGLDHCRQRPQREKAIITYLTDLANLEEVIHELTPRELELLCYLLARGGWAPLSAVSRKFGKMEGDGFFWNEIDPHSTTGSLWSMALVMVGKTIVDRRQVKIVAVPVDLREPMEKLIALGS